MTRSTVTILLILSFGLMSCDLEEKIDEAIIDVSGKVTHDGSAVSGAVVLLVEGTDVSDGLSLANGSITDNSGKFTILDVQEGVYYLLAIDDTNGNLEFDEDTDRLGFHGINPEGLDLDPDPITVSDSDVENVDVTSLYSLN